jgi:ribosomal protein S11
VEDAAAGRRTIREGLERAGVGVDRIDEVTPSLEDAFIARVEEAGGAPAD